MKKILVPVDFSDHSAHALKIAADLARKNNWEIIVLHVMEVEEPLMGTDQFYVSEQKMMFFMKMSQEKFSDFLNKEYLKGLKITDSMEAGPMTRSIVHAIEKFKADFIMMNTQGGDTPEETFIGPHTEKVIRDSEIPVLLIKDKIKNLYIQKIVFATDFSLESLLPYQKVKQFALDFDAELKLTYINTPGEKFKSSTEINQKSREFFEKAEIPYPYEKTTVHNDYSVEEGVLNSAHFLGADLIAIPTHGRKGLSHFFSGSIAEDVANQAQVPVITFKIDEK